MRVLLYHSIGNPADHRLAIRVPGENFRQQLNEIARRGYATRTVSEIIADGAVNGGAKDIVLTFDDGYKDNITEAATMIEAMGMKATFFVTTSYIDGRGRKAWADGNRRVYMDWDDVAQLARRGFEVGSHMVDHIDLSELKDDEIFFQLKASKEEISKRTGVEPKTFSYPYGKLDKRVAGLAKKAGYIGGCSLIEGLNTGSVDPYLLRRTEVSGLDTMDDFKAKLNS